MRSRLVCFLTATLFMGVAFSVAQKVQKKGVRHSPQAKGYKYNPQASRTEANNFLGLYNFLSSYGVEGDIVYDDNKFAIKVMFNFEYSSFSDWGFPTTNLGKYYTTKEKIAYLVDRGVFIPLDSTELDMGTKDKYYTTKKMIMHRKFDFMKDSCYLISGPPFLAPIRPWNSIVLTDLVNLEERHLSNEEKLKILLQRGILKKLTPKDDLKKLNKVTITYRAQNPEYVDGVLKENIKRDSARKVVFDQWFETVRDSLEKRVENEK